jgi:uncharacterized OB-fold protein
MTDTPFRVLPKVTSENEHFWRGGKTGELRFLECSECGYLVHPPAPVCPRCLCRELAPRTVSGRATVATYTVNHQPWYPGLDPPYVVAIVEIEEQADLRLMTNVVNCDVEKVRIGLPVQVTFEQHDDVWIPLFEPAA